MIEIVLLGYLDRLRGSNIRFITGDARLLMGWCLASLTGHPADFLTLPFIVLFAIGEAPGWGTPIGSGIAGAPMPKDNLEKWQIGILKTNVWLALAVRGGLWGAPMALLGYWDTNFYWLPLVFAVAMPMAVVLSRHIPDIQYIESNKWARQEYLRGWLVGALSFGIML